VPPPLSSPPRKPLAWDASPPPRDCLEPRFPPNRLMVFLTVSSIAPEPDVRLLPPL